MPDLDEIRSRLESVAEELADLALDRLRQAVSGGGEETTDDHAAEERRITRARRSVERAIAILGGGANDD